MGRGSDVTMLVWIAAIIILTGIALAAFAALSPGRKTGRTPAKVQSALPATSSGVETYDARAAAARNGELHGTTVAAPFEDFDDADDLDAFTNLGDDARCDAVFDAGTHDDPASTSLLQRALADPVEAVGIAAAHALIASGRGEAVAQFAHSNPSDRTQRIAAVAALLAPHEATALPAPRPAAATLSG